MAEQRLNVIFSADGSQLKKTLQELKEEQELLNQEIKDFNSAIKKNDAAIASASKALELLKRNAHANKDEIKKLNTELDGLRAKGVILNTQLKDAKNAFAGTTNQIKDYVREANRLRSLNESAANAFSRLTNVSSLAGQAIGQMRGQVVSLATSLLSGFVGGFVVSLVSELIPGLIGAAKGFKDAELNALAFKSSLDDVTEGMRNLREGLDFAARLNNLRFKAQFGEGFAADINEVTESIKANNRFIEESQNEFNKLTDNTNKAKETFKAFREETLKLSQIPGIEKASSGARQLALLFTDLEKIPKEAFDKLDDEQKAFVEAFRANNDALKKLTEQRNQAEESNAILGTQIIIKTNAERKALFEKAVKDFEQFQNDIISRGKELAKFFEGLLIVPQFTILDTKQEAFAKAKKFIDELAAGLFKIKMPDWKITPNIIIQANEIPVIIEPVFNQKTQDEFFEDLKRQFQGPYQVDLTIDIAIKREEIKKEFEDAVRSGSLRQALDAAQKELKDSMGKGTGVFVKLSEDIKNAAIAMNDILTPAFTSFFDAILEGENPIKAFFDSIVQSINQVIRKLIQAAVQAAILSAITGTPFGGNFLKGLSGLLGGGGGIAAPNIRGGGSIAFSLDSNVRFVIEGPNLVGVLNQGNALLGRVG